MQLLATQADFKQSALFIQARLKTLTVYLILPAFQLTWYWPHIVDMLTHVRSILSFVNFVIF